MLLNQYIYIYVAVYANNQLKEMLSTGVYRLCGVFDPMQTSWFLSDCTHCLVNDICQSSDVHCSAVTTTSASLGQIEKVMQAKATRHVLVSLVNKVYDKV